MTNQEIFDMYDRLFAEPGWKDLVEDFRQRQTQLANSLLYTATDKDLYKAQGQNHVYAYIIGLEDSIDAAKKHEVEEMASK